MFTSGQKIFAIFFIITFLMVTAYLFYKDSKDNKELFKGTYWILITLIAVAVAYVIVNRFLH